MATILHSRGSRTRTRAVPAETAAPVAPAHHYERPTGAALAGLTALVVGAWGALAGYIGPYFDFRPVAAHVWTNNLQNGLLHLLPGAVAAAAGLMLMAMGPARRSVRGGAFLLPAVLLLAAGAWFVIGPVAWPVFHGGPAFLPGTSPTRNLLNVAGSSYAPGLVLVMLGGMALKAGLVPAVRVEDPYMPAEAVTGRGAPVAGAGTAVADRPVADRRMAERDVADREVAGRRVADRGVADRGMAADPTLADRETADHGEMAYRPVGDRTMAERDAMADRPVGDATTEGPATDRAAAHAAPRTGWRRWIR